MPTATELFLLEQQQERMLYTNEQAVDAICYHLDSLISDIASEHLLDREEVLNGVWRKLTLDSVRARRRRLDILADLAHVLKAERS